MVCNVNLLNAFMVTYDMSLSFVTARLILSTKNNSFGLNGTFCVRYDCSNGYIVVTVS